MRVVLLKNHTKLNIYSIQHLYFQKKKTLFLYILYKHPAKFMQDGFLSVRMYLLHCKQLIIKNKTMNCNLKS